LRSTPAVSNPRDAFALRTPGRSRDWLTYRVADSRFVLFAVVAISLAYVGWWLDRDWIPWDDGALAHAAERVLQGELPHRDFDDIYTGGLAYLNAAAFRLLGTTLWSLRLVLLVFFVAWVPSVYYVASRFVRPAAAGVATLLAVVWSVPNYPAAMPSWYNLFFATFGAAALLRHLEDGRRRWLVAAGLAGGLSVLVKVVGLYYVAGALLFLVYQAHAESRAAAGPDARPAGAYALLVSAALATFVATLVMLVRHQLHAAEVAHFVFPSALVGALLVWNEWSIPAGANRARFVALARLVGPFLLGVAIPVTLFLVPYLWTGAVGALVNGVFILPTKRFGFAATRALPPLWTVAALLPLVVLLTGAPGLRARAPRSWLAFLAAALGALFAAALWSDSAYRFVWYTARNLPLLLVVAGVVAVARDHVTTLEASLQRRRAALLLGVMAVSGLMQYPFSLAIYFCYSAPLIVLTAVALLRFMPRLPAAVPAALAAFYLAFAVARVNGSLLQTMGQRYGPPVALEPLALPRGGIDVPHDHGPGYRELIAKLRLRARGGYTWASPDCPEIYFLSGLGNPTRSLFDFFDSPEQRSARVLSALEAHGVTAVVLNRFPAFSPDLRKDPILLAAILRRYPYVEDFGSLELRWRQ
jgi:hypothetical protein